MAQPQLATGRIVQKYTINGMTHRLVANVRNPQNVGGTWKINSRTLDENDTAFGDAASGLWESMTYMFPESIAAIDSELWEKVDNAWILRATSTPTGTNHGATTSYAASQVTLVLRDSAYFQLKVLALESPASLMFHYVSLASIGYAFIQNWAKQWTSSKTVTNAPYNWQVSDSNHYINAAGFVGCTSCFNRKLRRSRGLT